MGTGVKLLGDNNKTLIHRNNSGHKPPRSIVALHTPVRGDRAHRQINRCCCGVETGAPSLQNIPP